MERRKVIGACRLGTSRPLVPMRRSSSRSPEGPGPSTGFTSNGLRRRRLLVSSGRRNSAGDGRRATSDGTARRQAVLRCWFHGGAGQFFARPALSRRGRQDDGRNRFQAGRQPRLSSPSTVLRRAAGDHVDAQVDAPNSAGAAPVEGARKRERGPAGAVEGAGEPALGSAGAGNFGTEAAGLLGRGTACAPVDRGSPTTKPASRRRRYAGTNGGRNVSWKPGTHPQGRAERRSVSGT